MSKLRDMCLPPGTSAGIAPTKTNVIDRHGGFTVVTKGRRQGESTLWRPGHVLKETTEGTLVDINPKSFYQLNNDVTKATYKVAGYRYPVILWFDNKSGERIA